MSKLYYDLQDRFRKKGIKLEKFNGQEGTGYYFLALNDDSGNWKFISKSLIGVQNSILLNGD